MEPWARGKRQGAGGKEQRAGSMEQGAWSREIHIIECGRKDKMTFSPSGSYGILGIFISDE